MSQANKRARAHLPPLWTRERDRLARLVGRLMGETEGPSQSVVVEEPSFYGAGRLLEAMEPTLMEAGPVVRLSARHDAITDWPSLAMEIVSTAHASGAPQGIPREQLLAERRELGPIAFRESMDGALRDRLDRYRRLTLIVPNLDALLDAIGDQERWAFRNVLQTHPLSVVGSAAEGFRPGKDDAFYEFFRLFRLKSYESEDVAALARDHHLDPPATSVLRDISQELLGRPALVEAAAGLLAVGAERSVDAVIHRLADVYAPMLQEKLAALAPQQRLVLIEGARLGLPSESGPIAQAAGIASSAAAVQLNRLLEANILAADKSEGRNRLYDFADPIFARLYSALVKPRRAGDDRGSG